jgi:purine-binding chemotaxis protein CheW
MRSPEEHFLETTTLPEEIVRKAKEGGEFTAAETEFLAKYVGLDAEGKPLMDLPPDVAAKVERSFEGPLQGDSADRGGVEGEGLYESEDDLLEALKAMPSIQLVGFLVDGREFTVPTLVVQEVIRFEEPIPLPQSTPKVAGIINLRGAVTPLVKTHDMLGAAPAEDPGFIVVLRRDGLQFGLIIDKLKTMYNCKQEQVEWNVEAHLGVNADTVVGLMKKEQELIGILSVDRVKQHLLI